MSPENQIQQLYDAHDSAVNNTDAKGPQELLAEMTKERDAAVDHASKVDARIADAIKRCAEERPDYATELESCDRWIEFCKQQKPEDWYGINFMQGKRSGIVLGNIIHSKQLAAVAIERDEALSRVQATKLQLDAMAVTNAELTKALAAITDERDEMLRRIGANETADLLLKAIKAQCDQTLYWKGVVRGARAELHEAGRISDEEYAALCEDTAARDHMDTLDEVKAERDSEREARKALAVAVLHNSRCCCRTDAGSRHCVYCTDRANALELAAKLPA